MKGLAAHTAEIFAALQPKYKVNSREIEQFLVSEIKKMNDKL